MKKANNGITLVALVITIIVLLILAGVTISLIMQGGIIDKAQNATGQYQEQQIREEIQIAIADCKAEAIEEKMELTPEILANKLSQKLENSQIDIEEQEVIGNYKEYNFIILDLNINVLTKGNLPPKIDKIVDKNITMTGKDNGTYQDPIIPKGFKAVNTQEAKWDLNDKGVPQGWNNGLVIEDENQNQFVWIPVSNNSIERIDWGDCYGGYFNNYLDVKEDSHYPQGQVKYSEMQIAVLKQQGFYFSRYEVKLENGKLASKENGTVYTANRSTAESGCQNMYASAEAVVSHLPWGGEWDAVVNFIGVPACNTSPGKNIYGLVNGGEVSQERTSFSAGTIDGDVARAGSTATYREQWPINYLTTPVHVCLFIKN